MTDTNKTPTQRATETAALVNELAAAVAALEELDAARKKLIGRRNRAIRALDGKMSRRATGDLAGLTQARVQQIIENKPAAPHLRKLAKAISELPPPK